MDFYALLGVKADAPVEEIRRAYRKAALKHHPDRNPGDVEAERKFKIIGEAYDVLSDIDKRKKYDRDRASPPPPPPPPPNYPVASISVEVEVNAYDLRNGNDKTVTVSRPRTCPACHGNGQHWHNCGICMGQGCQPCGWSGKQKCAQCWGTGQDRETTLITVRVPAGVNPYGRVRLVGNGNLWGLRGPFYIDANIRYMIPRPGLIIRK